MPVILAHEKTNGRKNQEFKVIPLRYIASSRYQAISVIIMRVMMMNIDHDVVDDDDDVQFLSHVLAQSDYVFGSQPQTQILTVTHK